MRPLNKRVPLIVSGPEMLEALTEYWARIQEGANSWRTASCTLCGNPNFLLLGNYDTYGIPITTGICTQCANCYTTVFPDMFDSGFEMYRSLYRRIDRGWSTPDTSFFMREVEKGKALCRLLGTLDQDCSKFTNVLDVGCGTGGALVPFQELGCQILGIDLDSAYLDLGRCAASLPLEQRTLEELAATGVPRKFDLVIVDQVLEHVLNPIDFLRTIRNLLSSEGLIYVSVPGYRNIRDHYGGDLRRYLQFPHLTHFDATAIAEVAHAAGLQCRLLTERVEAILAIGDVEENVSWGARDPFEVLEFFNVLDNEWKANSRTRFQDFLRQVKRRAQLLSVFRHA